MEKNKYLLTAMVAKRAKQLIAGAKPLIKIKFKNPVAIALKEIEEGKVYLKKQKGLEKEDLFKRVLRFRPEEEDRDIEFELSVWEGDQTDEQNSFIPLPLGQACQRCGKNKKW